MDPYGVTNVGPRFTLSDYGITDRTIAHFGVDPFNESPKQMFAWVSQGGLSCDIDSTECTIFVKCSCPDTMSNIERKNLGIILGECILSNNARVNNLALSPEHREFSQKLENLILSISCGWMIAEHVLLGRPVLEKHTSEEEEGGSGLFLAFPVFLFLIERRL